MHGHMKVKVATKSVRLSFCLYYNKSHLQWVLLLHIIPLHILMSMPKTNDIRGYRNATPASFSRPLFSSLAFGSYT